MSIASPACRVLTFLTMLAVAACHSRDLTVQSPPGDQIVFTPAQINSLDSTGQVLKQNNSTDPTVKALVDSTLLVLTSGVVAKRVGVTTDLTSAPLFFVGVHRVYTGSNPFSTWTVIGMDDPSHLTSIVELGAFAPSNTESVSGPVSDVLNGLLLSVGAGGSVTEWFVASGSGSILSTATNTPCPNFPAAPNVTCTLETIHVGFSIVGSTNSPTNGTRQATVSPVDVPAMRLTYTGP